VDRHICLLCWRRSSSERELIAAMGRLKAERLVEPVRVGTAPVGGELDETAAALAALADRPFQHRPADPAAAFARRDPDALALAAPHAPPRQAGNTAELQHANDPAAALGDREQLVWIALDRGESVVVAGIHFRPGVFALLAKRVVGEQGYDRRQ